MKESPWGKNKENVPPTYHRLNSNPSHEKGKELMGSNSPSTPDPLSLHKRRKIELLAPAKNKEVGILAVKSGADAVYIGAEKFGAREDAGNSLKDIEELIKFSHIYRAKVYATVNTLLKDWEIDDAHSLIVKLYEMGIDGVIIQDMGLLEMDLPPVKLIASTQTNNRDWKKVKFLEDAGFQRVILARELDLDEIREIRKNTQVELECFVHGSLCVCYSGQCYMSYFIGGRSGNRGACAQPCRETYSLTDREGRLIKKNLHPLSLKDLNLSDYLEDLIDIGVGSFKIEGRLKDEDYVMNTTAFYRQKLDDILEEKKLSKSSVGRIFYDFTPSPHKTFNRGFSDYFIQGRQKDLSCMESPKSRGEFIGTVVEKEGDFFVINTDKKLIPGDGICFLNKNKKLTGTNINEVNKNKIKVREGKELEKGVSIYRNFDKNFNDTIKRSKTDRKIKIVFLLYQEQGQPFLKVSDEEGFSVSIPWASSGEPVKMIDKFQEQICKNLYKLGDTEFYAQEVKIDTLSLTFLTVKEINEHRRNIIEKLKIEREKGYFVESFPHKKNTIPYPEKRLDYRGNVVNPQAYDFYKRHGVEKIEAGAETGTVPPDSPLMQTRYCLKYELGMCNIEENHPISSEKECKPGSVKEPLFLTDKKGNRFRLKFDCRNCGMEIYPSGNERDI